MSGLQVGLSLDDMRTMPLNVLVDRIDAYNALASGEVSRDGCVREATASDMGLLF